MKERILSLVELDTLKRNLDMLEDRLGYPAPAYLLDDEDLSNHIMSFTELDTTVRNIEMIYGRSKNVNNSALYRFLDSGIYWVFGIIVLILMFV